MIMNSFLFLEGIGRKGEISLWQQGIRDWQSFRSRKANGIGERRKARLDLQLHEAGKALAGFDSGFFSKIMPSQETWRLYDHFREGALYLDIETTGLSRFAKTTVVGIYDGRDSKALIRGKNLDARTLRGQLAGHSLIVTFNGASFDLPFLEREFPGCLPDIPHIDLRPVCAAVGMKGGLKRIEKAIGIARREMIEGFGGGDAVTLWRMYNATCDPYYRDLLIEYNEEDTVNLERLAGIATNQLKALYKNRYFPD